MTSWALLLKLEGKDGVILADSGRLALAMRRPTCNTEHTATGINLAGSLSPRVPPGQTRSTSSPHGLQPALAARVRSVACNF